MRTTTIRLDDQDEALLDLLAPEYGGRSGALREGLRELAADRLRRDNLAAFLEQWTEESGPVDETAVTQMAERYSL